MPRSVFVTPVLQRVQRMATRHLRDRSGLKSAEGHGGSVTLIQRFGWAANPSIRLHCLVLDGVYRCDIAGVPALVEYTQPPTTSCTRC